MLKNGFLAVVSCLLIVFAGCDSSDGGFSGAFSFDDCKVDTKSFRDGGVAIDGIPALTDPNFIDAADATYLQGNERVIGLVENGEPIAVPHNILWYHEIANFNHGSRQTAVTYCPLTGSSLIFDRDVINGNEFGVSGLLFTSNLTMYDRSSSDLERVSLWPQMNVEASCGAQVGESLPVLPVIEMTWDGWLELHPDSKVLSDETGFNNRNYTVYPYVNYEDVNNSDTFGNVNIDDRRPPKERVLGLPDGTGGSAYPFLTLNSASDASSQLTVINTDYKGRPVVIFWDGDKQAAAAFYRDSAVGTRSFTVDNGSFVDDVTNSIWRVDGREDLGNGTGDSLEPVAEAYVAFWFAWALFQPSTTIWNG